MSKLDPYLGFMTGQSILFENEVATIRREASAIASRADLLALLKTSSGAMARYDLRRSAQDLRDAASRLDELYDRQTQFNVAAE